MERESGPGDHDFSADSPPPPPRRAGTRGPSASTDASEPALPTPGLDREDKLTRGEYAPGEGHGLTAPAPMPVSTAQSDYRTELAFSERQLLGMGGALLLIFGVFFPVVSMPVIGTLSMFSANTLAGAMVLGLGAYGFFASARNDFRYVQWAGLLALIIIALLFLNLLRAPRGVTLEDGDPLGIAELLQQGVNYMWGWAVLLVGAAVLFLSGRLRDEFRMKRRRPGPTV
jgi:hypothetical protein